MAWGGEAGGGHRVTVKRKNSYPRMTEGIEVTAVLFLYILAVRIYWIHGFIFPKPGIFKFIYVKKRTSSVDREQWESG